MLTPSSFRPPWWCRNPHAQTLVAARLRAAPAVPLRAERLHTPDDDFLDLHWFGEPERAQVVLFHGLEGDSGSAYARGLMQTLRSHGVGGAVMHFRGCSGEPNRQMQSYHCAHTTDIAWVLQQLARRRPDTPLFAVGYSIGAAALLNTLALEPLPAALRLSVAVSPPFEPRAGAERMNRGFSRLYQRALIRECVASARAKLAAGVALPIDAGLLDSTRSFWEFDHRVTAPLHGFASAEDYYARAAPRQRLRDIEAACHIVHAADDPFFDRQMIPRAEELGARTTLELSEHGGHVGFVAGPPWRPVYWLERRIAQLIETALATGV